jgi:SAM-dependent methyltransferase
MWIDMPEEVKVCPLCRSTHSRLFNQRIFRGRSVINRLCLDCGLVYQSPRMSAAEAEAFYAQEYRPLNEGASTPSTRNSAAQRLRAESLLGFTRGFVQTVSRHLDIGCSFGALLQLFRSAYYCQSIGIEPGDSHRELAQKDGLQVYVSLEDLEKHETQKFDLISLAHVLEHLPDPVNYLTHLRQSLLETSGWMLLEVPNLYFHDSFEVAHLTAFSRHTLQEALRESGFAVVKLEQHGRPSSSLFPLFLTALCHPKPSPQCVGEIAPEHFVALKRHLGMAWRQVLGRLFPRRAWKELA